MSLQTYFLPDQLDDKLIEDASLKSVKLSGCEKQRMFHGSLLCNTILAFRTNKAFLVIGIRTKMPQKPIFPAKVKLSYKRRT